MRNDNEVEEEYYTCPACENTFVTQRSLSIHMIFHEKDPKFPCSQCTQIFYKEQRLEDHVIQDHTIQNNDDKKVVVKEEVAVKEEDNELEDCHSCEICGQQLPNKDLLFAHYKNLHPDLVQLESEDEGDGYEQEVEEEDPLSVATQVIKEENGFSRKRKHSPDPELPHIKIKIPLIPTLPDSDEDDEFEDGDDDEDQEELNSQFNKVPTYEKSNEQNLINSDKDSHISSLDQYFNSKILPTFPLGLGFHLIQPENVAIEQKVNRNPSSNSKKLQCHECSASFTNTFNLERHKESHRANRPHKCHLCPDNRGFLRKEHLTKHMSSVHSGMKFTCEFCGKDISRKDHLVRHIRNVHTAEIMGITTPQTTMTTGASTFIGSTSISLSDDISITAVPTKVVRAQEPQIQLNGQKAARSISIKSENFETTISTVNSNTFSTPITYSTPNTFSTSSTFTFSTPITQANTLSLSDKALLSLQPKPKKPYVTCDMCTGLQFADINELYEHQRLVHSDVRKFLCDYCPKSFKRREHLNKHFVLHTGEKNFSCNTCLKDFPRKDALMDHIRRIHAGINGNEISPHVAMQQLLQSQGHFRCDLCEKSFLQKHSLVRHMKTVHSVPSQYINGTVVGAGGNYDDMDYELYGDGEEENLANNNGLIKHPSPPPLVSITSTQKSVIPCPHCKATFSDESRLSLHLNIHKVS